MRTIVRDPALLLLGLTALISLASLPFLSMAPNRLAQGIPLGMMDLPYGVLVVALPAATLIATAFFEGARIRWLLALVSAMALIVASLAVAGLEATHLANPAQPAQRIALGSGFWLAVTAAVLALATLSRASSASRIYLRVAVFVGLISLGAAMAGGVFANLSLTREFASHRALFGSALVRHAALVLAALAGALAVAAPLATIVTRTAQRRRTTFQALSLLQTIPSIALFGLLIAPLSALAAAVPFLGQLGLAGTGPVPAVIALTLYALLPLVRSFHTGFAQVSADVLDAARGLGFDRRQRFWRLALPLALPALLSGLRVVTIQTIGLAAVAALIGAGGLGTFIFQGIGQYALDLVLIGALPIVILALAVDFAFAGLIRSTRGAA
jgi:osmoprotectant transport system permease protein